MGYELSLRSPTPEVPVPDAALLQQALRSAGAVGAESSFSLPVGGAQLAAKVAWNDGALLGIDLDVPFGAPEADFRAAVLTATKLAVSLGLSLMDPQLGTELGPTHAEKALEQWRSANKYAVDTLGVAEDARNATYADPIPKAISPRAKAMLIALGVLVVAYWILSFMLGHLLTPALPPID